MRPSCVILGGPYDGSDEFPDLELGGVLDMLLPLPVRSLSDPFPSTPATRFAHYKLKTDINGRRTWHFTEVVNSPFRQG